MLKFNFNKKELWKENVKDTLKKYKEVMKKKIGPEKKFQGEKAEIEYPGEVIDTEVNKELFKNLNNAYNRTESDCTDIF